VILNVVRFLLIRIQNANVVLPNSTRYLFYKILFLGYCLRIYCLTTATVTLVWLSVKTEIGAIGALRTQRRSNHDRRRRQLAIIRG